MEDLVIDGIEAAVKETPEIVGAFQQLFASGAPTDADFVNFRAAVAAESYKGYVPTTLIPANQQVPPPAGN